jgi:DNA-binding MurR/RpiR family transcriptional regulator
MQKALDTWLVTYNTKRPHQRRNMNERTPLQALIDGLLCRASQPTQKPGREPLTASSKQASINHETKAA